MRYAIKEKGFTLIELIAVVAIIAVIATMVAPNLDRLSPKYSLRAGVREIASTIELCRSQSIITGKTYSIVYDLDENRYWILLPEELDEFGEPLDDEREIMLPKKTLQRNVLIAEVLTPDNDSHTSGQVQFDFSPFGNTGSHVALVRYDEEEELHIWVRTNALLGFTTFHYNEVVFMEYEQEEDDETYGQESGRGQTP